MPIRPFTDTLAALRLGSLSDDLSDKMNELTNKCVETGRAGSLTLKITLKPGNAGQIEVLDDIKMTMPKEQKGSSLMFATTEGNLQREDPRQKSLPGIRSVDDNSSKAAPRTVENLINSVRQVG